MSTPIKEHYLTPTAFGRAASVSPRTVQHWCARGRLPVSKDTAGQYRIPSAFVELVKEGTLPLAQRTKRTIAL